MEAISLMAECVQCQQCAFGVNHSDSISSSMALAEWKAEEASTGNNNTVTGTAISVAENEISQWP